MDVCETSTSNNEERNNRYIDKKNNNFDDIQNNSGSNNLNQMTIIYGIKSYNDSIMIFGEDFVKNNKNNCYILIDGQKIKLCKNIILNEIQKKQGVLKIKLIETNKIINMSHMFYDCDSLDSIPDISQWNTKDVIDMSFMFYGFKSIHLIDISKWDIRNVTNMSSMFRYCKSLPDISKWDTKNVKDMSCMFDGCSKLSVKPVFRN